MRFKLFAKTFNNFKETGYIIFIHVCTLGTRIGSSERKKNKNKRSIFKKMTGKTPENEAS